MKQIKLILALAIICSLAACKGKKLEEKGFSVNQSSENNENNNADGISKDSLLFETRPSSVLLTGLPQHRLTTIYKVNYDKNDETSFIGSNSFHCNYSEFEESEGNQWNSNLMPGITAVYGYNLVNISHYDIVANKQNNFFDKPVLIKTLYYPSLSKDTLNAEPVKRNYFMVSVYDEDTNRDGFINVKDLRRLYLFDINGVKQKALVPANYSVVKSEYDAPNDLMYVFAQLDQNKNGQINKGEQTHIFWISLKDPNKSGREY